MDIKKRNSRAGVHPSYDKLKMSPESIKKKRKRDAAYNKKPAAVAYRVKLNAFNRKNGKKGDGLDASHTSKGKIVLAKQSVNRAANGQGKRKKHHV